MPSPYLLDTNTVSCLLKGNDPAVDKRLAKMPMARVAISSITEGELRYGVARKPEAARLRTVVDTFLRHAAILPWDSKAAKEYGDLRAGPEREGYPLGNLDTMIAAHALALRAVLVTSDRAFSRIEKLKIEDWNEEKKT
jgi:tRNA(fMet)-specific endonuclease VapC